jgi:hypothetical protein
VARFGTRQLLLILQNEQGAVSNVALVKNRGFRANFLNIVKSGSFAIAKVVQYDYFVTTFLKGYYSM